MGRLTMTNDREMHLWIVERDKKAGFADYDTAVSGGVFLAVHRKKRNPVKNFIQLENGDFIACAGTFIYKNHLGTEALEQLYGDFDDDIDELRKKAMGNYVVAIKKGCSIFVFVDKYESLLTYYTCNGGRWVVGNSLSAVASAVSRKGTSLEVNELALVEEAFVGTIIGKDTLFRNVYRLAGTEYLSVDAETQIMEIMPIPYERIITNTADRTLEQSAARFAELLRAKLDGLQSIFASNISIFATGGIDTRLLLAGLMASGCKPSLVHGVGSTPPFDTPAADLAIVRMCAAEFGLDLHTAELRYDKDAASSYYDQGFEKCGFYATMGPWSKDFFELYERGPFGKAGLILHGAYGELIRKPGSLDLSRYWMECFAEEYFSLDQFTKFHLAGLNKHERRGMCIQYGALHDYLRAKLEEDANRFGVEKHNGLYGRDSFQLMYDPCVRGAYPGGVNLINMYTCSVSVLNTYDLHELAFDVPMEWRANDHFALQVMQQLYPPLLDIPFFSHTKHMVLGKKSLELRQPWRTQLVPRMSNLLQTSQLGRRIHKLLRPLHHDRRLRWTDPKRVEIRAVAQNLMPFFRSFVDAEQQEQQLCLIDPYAFAEDDLQTLVKYGQLLYFIRKVRDGSATQ